MSIANFSLAEASLAQSSDTAVGKRKPPTIRRLIARADRKLAPEQR